MENVPTGQGLHVSEELATYASDHVPAGHAWQFALLEEPATVEKKPFPQGVQSKNSLFPARSQKLQGEEKKVIRDMMLIAQGSRGTCCCSVRPSGACYARILRVGTLHL